MTAFPHSLFPIPNYLLSPYGGAVQADGIQSANTVGYSSQDVKAGQFYMVAVQFADVGAAVDKADFNSYISTTCSAGEYGSGEDTTMNGAPMIQVLKANGIGYDFYYYISDAYDSTDNPVDGNCWADANGYIVTADDMQNLSKGFWFKATVDGQITCAGQVSSTDAISRTLIAGQFEIVANPYPVALNLNSADSTGFTAGEYGSGEDTTMNGAPMIQVLKANGIGYDFYYYISDAYDSTENPVGVNCWADANGYITTGTQVPVGQAFWVKSAAAGTFTFGL